MVGIKHSTRLLGRFCNRDMLGSSTFPSHMSSSSVEAEYTRLFGWSIESPLFLALAINGIKSAHAFENSPVLGRKEKMLTPGEVQGESPHHACQPSGDSQNFLTVGTCWLLVQTTEIPHVLALAKALPIPEVVRGEDAGDWDRAAGARLLDCVRQRDRSNQLPRRTFCLIIHYKSSQPFL